METARSSSLHCRLVDTGAELKLKRFGSQNPQISNENPPPPHAQGLAAKSHERKGAAGLGDSFCTKRDPPPPPPRQAGRSGHNSAAPRAQPAPEPLQLPCAGLKQVGRGGCAPELALLTAHILASPLQEPRERDTAAGEAGAAGGAEAGEQQLPQA